jgi:hypothetical protein
MCRPGRRGLQLDDGPPDPPPKGLSFETAPFEHEVGSPRGFDLCLASMLADQQVRGSPYVEIGEARQSRHLRLDRFTAHRVDPTHAQDGNQALQTQPWPLRVNHAVAVRAQEPKIIDLGGLAGAQGLCGGIQ